MKPETKGSWEKRCAALYQVIGGLASVAGIFETSKDVARALDVACGRGNVDRLVPWPRDMEMWRRLEKHGREFMQRERRRQNRSTAAKDASSK